MKVQIKTKRTVKNGIKKGKYSCIVGNMINNHCGKIGNVVCENSFSYGIIFDDDRCKSTWYWPKWCCKIIKEEVKNERTS